MLRYFERQKKARFSIPVEAFRRMPPTWRLALALQLYWSARELKTDWLKVHEEG